MSLYLHECGIHAVSAGAADGSGQGSLVTGVRWEHRRTTSDDGAGGAYGSVTAAAAALGYSAPTRWMVPSR
jgi:hypothetical protein